MTVLYDCPKYRALAFQIFGTSFPLSSCTLEETKLTHVCHPQPNKLDECLCMYQSCTEKRIESIALLQMNSQLSRTLLNINVVCFQIDVTFHQVRSSPLISSWSCLLYDQDGHRSIHILKPYYFYAACWNNTPHVNDW